jgi:hypothetical protein
MAASHKEVASHFYLIAPGTPGGGGFRLLTVHFLYGGCRSKKAIEPFKATRQFPSYKISLLGSVGH